MVVDYRYLKNLLCRLFLKWGIVLFSALQLMIPCGFECVPYDIENESEVDTEEDLYGFILFLQHFS